MGRETTIEVKGKDGKPMKLILDWDLYQAEQEWTRKKEAEIQADPAFRSLMSRVLKRMIDAGNIQR